VISAESDDDSSHFIIVRPEQKHRAASDDPNIEHLIVASGPMADIKCVYGIVTRVVYSRSLPEERLKSPEGFESMIVRPALEQERRAT
jgi:hypothetical protein